MTLNQEQLQQLLNDIRKNFKEFNLDVYADQALQIAIRQAILNFNFNMKKGK